MLSMILINSDDFFICVLPVRVLLYATKVNLLRWYGEQLVLTFLEGAVQLLGLFSFACHVGVHRFFGNAPAGEVEPAVAFHSQLYAALVTNGLAQIVLVIVKGNGLALYHGSVGELA